MNLSLFALNGSRQFGEKVADALATPLGRLEERGFEDGEHKIRPLQSVRGCDVFVIHSLYGDGRQSVNDKLVRFIMFVGALKDASAARVTAVIPYLCYARKDRKTKSRDPVSTRYLAEMLESVGVDRVVTLDVHNLAAYQNAFRIPTDHLEAKHLFVSHYAAHLANDDIVVVSPDIGGVKRAEAFRQTLEHKLARSVGTGFMEKHRSAGVVSGDTLVGDVNGKSVIIIDDLISSGGTIVRTVMACAKAGAQRIYAAAAHGLFVAGADDALADPRLNELIVTDSVPPFRLRSETVRSKLVVLDATELFAQAVNCIHNDRSIIALLET